MDYLSYIFVERLIGFLIGIMLVYSAYKLFKVLENKEIAISMVFLHKKRVINLFGLLVLASILIFISGLSFVILGNGILVEILLDLDGLILLIFTFLLQRLMSGDEGKWTS